MDRVAAAAILARLHAAQGAFYAGGAGADAALRAVLDPAIEWHVPGRLRSHLVVTQTRR